MKAKLCVWICGIIILFFSCERNNDKNLGEYLVKYELLKSSSAEKNKNGLQFASILFPEFDSLVTYSKYGTNIYKVEYNTTFLGEKIIASGLVTIPQKDTLFPLVSFQNGTNTCNENAPSENSGSNFFSLICMMAGNGYIISIPDYIGFGASDYILHPYLHQESSNNAIIDLIRATQELIAQQKIEAQFNGDLYLMGYSQGGWATLSVLYMLENNPLPHIQVAAAAGGAGAFDLIDMAHYILGMEEYNSPYFLPYFIESRRQNNILTDSLITFFNEPYISQIPELFDGSTCDSEINSEFTTHVSDLISFEMLTDFDESTNLNSLKNEMIINSISSWNLQTRLRIFHSKGDKTIPCTQSENLYRSFIDNYNIINEKISIYVLNDTLDHGDAVIPWGIDALLWFQKIKD